jgi:hypothetical protein
MAMRKARGNKDFLFIYSIGMGIFVGLGLTRISGIAPQ